MARMAQVNFILFKKRKERKTKNPINNCNPIRFLFELKFFERLYLAFRSVRILKVNLILFLFLFICTMRSCRLVFPWNFSHDEMEKKLYLFEWTLRNQNELHAPNSFLLSFFFSISFLLAETKPQAEII